MGRLSLLTAALLTIAFPVSAHGQPSPADRVRILTQSGLTISGKVVEVWPDSMQLQVEGGPLWVNRSDIAFLERSAGQQRRFGRNFAITVVSTAAIGGAIGAITWEECVSNAFLGCLMAPESRADAFVFGAVAGGAIGIPLGVLVGLALRHDRWEPVHVSKRVSLSISPLLRRGPGVSALLRF